ncbi:TPA: site-specific DNA-methyltransferase [Pseudomonas aeruginosa]|uniref:site-specific DNA-methyltransferase n=1 Tax=Pseudomonas TaxID=286 RepID=UPI000940CBD6|nr:MULTISPECIES: site-specific DNA-methyltransferase [Pseudomonas]ELH5325973.1 site-specific DNA-methyltransferase [Pseudomonas aeruginosa]MBY5289785.1 site-specific DNA-methyltransferase [Pseudomonas aeruginosa]MCK2121194.1 site-specific DNA-methyltransferase [Pseudomonas sp. PNPG3]MCV6240272.1 site-specific DNA-methyltransferase [Pseudomonas aeruginosa]MCV6526691.1 site-specific DNA-methyltransferase [Pseudomonas aeruginosa]
MDKLKMQSTNLVEDNIGKLAELFPNCITEIRSAKGELKKTVDFDLLRQELSPFLVEGPQERYQLNWPGKREALLTANSPIAKTLRPYVSESVDFDTTRNLFIEGDNLDALKLMQEAYLGRVKLIYIDPPYNTGNDFIYEDDFSDELDAYLERSNQKSMSGQKLVLNSETNGRFHSDWLSMIYSRIKVARNLLREDGAVFISIDDNELSNLKSVCDEIFGEGNFRGVISRATGTRMGSGNKKISSELDYVVVYSKSESFEFSGLSMTSDDLSIYDQEDDKGRYLTRSLRRTGGENKREDRPTMFFPVQSPDGEDVYPLAPEGWESRWICSQEKYKELLNSGMIEWRKVKKGGEEKWQVYQKHYLGEGVKQTSNFWNDIDGNKKATRELNELFDGEKVFDHPKPLSFVQKIISIAASGEDDIVLDFFAGSGTTAHAVLKQNYEDQGRRRFILVQVPEILSEDNRTQLVAARFCDRYSLPRTVSELTKERVRRAGVKFKSGFENGLLPGIDVGFRVVKVDVSNMKDVYYSPDALSQGELPGLVDNIREDRTAEDLLFQVLLDWGVDLALPIHQETIADKQVFFVDGNALVVCFDKGIDEAFVKQIAEHKPLRVVFRDNGFASDSVKINVEQLFKLLSPMTEIKTL